MQTQQLTTWQRCAKLEEAGFQFNKDDGDVWHCTDPVEQYTLASSRQKGKCVNDAWDLLN